MTSRPSPRWIAPRTPDADMSRVLAGTLAIPDRVAALLVQRGYADPDVAKRFLRPRLEQLHDATTMAGLATAVDRLARAVRNGERIMIHGDYDVDGICSTTLMLRTLRLLGADAVPFIPHRLTDGYDLSDAGVRKAIEIGARVVVTCDCGTSALEAIDALHRAGIDVVISDHHLPKSALPTPLALLNPRRPDCEYPDKDLAAVGVAFKLALALTREMKASDAPVWKMLDLVALATVADVAPLRGENRVFVRYGLRMLAETENVGLRALLRASGMDGKTLTAGRIGFTLAPRLNAAGRLGHALRGVDLLTTDSEHEANAIARELEELNRTRQGLDRATLDEARTIAAARVRDDGAYGLVIAKDGWHAGVIGIVASRIVEEFARPAVLVALEGDTGKGSGRSISAFDLHAALGECSDLLLRYGGHRAAAGVTVSAERVGDFARRFDEVARARLTEEDLRPELRIDAEIPLAAATAELESVLRHFEPFGVGNPSPTFAARNVSPVTAPRLIGKDGVRVRLIGDGAELDAIGWGMAHMAPLMAPGRRLDVAFRLERDEYQGESRLQARLADVIPR